MATRIRITLPADAAAKLATIPLAELSEALGIPVLSIAQVNAREETNVFDVSDIRRRLGLDMTSEL